MFRNLWRKIAAKIIGDDPNPQPSNLDRWDGRGTVPLDDDGPLPMTPAYAESLRLLRDRLLQPDDEYEARQAEAAKRGAWS
jgi:hypothetical protein